METSTLTVDPSLVSDADGNWLPEEEQPPLDWTDGDPQCARNYWALILLLASRDDATSIHFFPRLDEDCLWFVIHGNKYGLVAPPAECRRWLLRVGRDLCAGGTWRSKRWWWKAHVLRCWSRGPVTLQFWGNCTKWIGRFGPQGITFERIREIGD